MPFSRMKKGEKVSVLRLTSYHKKFWNLYTHGVSQSAIKRFRECPVQFKLSMLEGWTSKKVSPALEFGSCFHDGVAFMEKIANDRRKIDRAIKHYVDKVTLQRKPGATELEALSLATSQAAIVMRHYLTYYGTKDDGREWVAREVVFKVDSPVIRAGTRGTGEPFEIVIPLTGRWDGLFFQKEKSRTGKVFRLHEMKTKGRIDEELIQAGLSFDLQTMIYCYAAKLVYGYDIAGTVYDVVRQPQLRLGKSESVDAFLKRIDKDITSDPKKYFMRWEVNIDKGDLDRFVNRQLIPILSQLDQWYVDTLAHPDRDFLYGLNEDAFVSRYGSRSDFFNLITKGNSFGLYRRKKPFPELED